MLGRSWCSCQVATPLTPSTYAQSARVQPRVVSMDCMGFGGERHRVTYCPSQASLPESPESKPNSELKPAKGNFALNMCSYNWEYCLWIREDWFCSYTKVGTHNPTREPEKPHVPRERASHIGYFNKIFADAVSLVVGKFPRLSLAWKSWLLLEEKYCTVPHNKWRESF
jgi:hypothetical protein